jgi:membrane protease YdiL (CAAX protease family)
VLIEPDHVAVAEMIVAGIDAAMILAFWRITRTTLVPAFTLGDRAGRGLIIALALLAPLLALNFGYHHALLALFGVEPGTPDDPFVAAGFGLGSQVLWIAVMPGFWEELAFRGLMFERLRTVVSPQQAVVVTAMLFAIIHVSPLSMPYLLLMGLVLGWLRLRSGSLLPGMVLHAAHNLVIVLLEDASRV